MQIIQNRRHFLAGAAAAGAAGLLGTARRAWAEPPPETTTVRLPAVPAACAAPLYLAEELLHEEGFAEVRYVPTTRRFRLACWRMAALDFSMEAAVDYLPLIDAGKPLTVLSGVHVGCMELRANDSIQAIADLRGKRVGISAIGARRPFAGERDGRLCRARSRAEIELGRDPIGQPGRALHRRQGRRFHRLSARSPGSRARATSGTPSSTSPRSSLVELFLLHGDRQCRFRAQQSGGDQARHARHPQGDRHLPPADRSARRNGWSISVSRLRVRAHDPERRPLRRCGGTTTPKTPSVSLRSGCTKRA